MNIFDPILNTIQQFEEKDNFISEERKAILQQVAQYIIDKKQAGLPIHLNFICTHNSRRSHLAQVWASVAAYYYGIYNVSTYSGGTEATAFNPRAVAALERIGFQIENPGGENPQYIIQFSPSANPIQSFSKVYNHPSNPSTSFAAIMTCSDADENCPFIPGVEKRIALTYDDPKASDGTDKESKVYTERAIQIGREIFYAFSLIQ